MKKGLLLLMWMMLICTYPLAARIIFSSIDTAGFYRLADDVTNEISINVSDVTLDLNGHRVSGGTNGIAIAAGLDRVTIKNGMVDGVSDGISVGAGATNITLDGILAKDSVVGFNFTQVTGGLIKNCEMTQNATGLELDNCHKIVVENCTASCNTHAGYDLLSSTTNCFENCKALSTGEGNTNVTDNNVFGFVSTNGYGNIFERCIANSTQALSTTDYNSTIAGFALRGTEGCTKIVESEAANSTTSPDGVTVPYGIFLEGTFDQLTTLTQTVDAPRLDSIGWSPDGKYIAIGTFPATDVGFVRVYEYDRIARLLTFLSESSYGDFVLGLEWSPDGIYIAAGGGNRATGVGFSAVEIFQFDPVNETISKVASGTFTVGTSLVIEVVWSPDGQFVAACGSTGGSPVATQRIFKFDRINNTLTEVTQSDNGIQTEAIDWSHRGDLIATGDDNGVLRIQRFNRTGSTLDLVTTVTVPNGGDDINDLKWSPDDKYIALGSERTGGDDMYVYKFENDTLTLVASVEFGNVTFLNELNWSADGRYIALTQAADPTTDSRFAVYEFDRGALQLNFIDSSPYAEQPRAIEFSPDGTVIAAGGVVPANGSTLQIYTGIDFPQKNILKDNVTYCNSGAECPSGVGISGSSILNLIIRNSSYSNPIPGNGNTPVPSNYYFVTNVFDGLSSGVPSPIQNASFAGCEPACLTTNIAEQSTLILQKVCNLDSSLDSLISFTATTGSKVCDIQTKVDIIVDELDSIESKLDALQGCDPTAVLTAGTISSAGSYCLANAIAGALTISASDVVLDLNNYTVSSGITVNGGLDRVTIKNGEVSGSGDAILVNAGSSNITITDVAVKNAIRGINFSSVSGGIIKNCELTQNTTGLELDNSHKIVVRDCIARCNTHAGYDLISSTTNCFEHCKALSTGEDNSNILDNNVFGFVSTDGYGNIFERCIANSTQALTTTDLDSVVAGFALRGTEGCTKIIECESANAVTDEAGATTPYGIFIENENEFLTTLTTSTRASGSSNDTQIQWSPSGRFLGATYSATNDASVFAFDGTRATPLIELVSVSPLADYQIAWAPNEQYLMLGTEIYLFDPTGSLTLFAAVSGTPATFSISDWHPTGRYVALGPTLRVFEFIPSAEEANRLISLASISDVTRIARSFQWSPDGRFLAVGYIFSSGTPDLLSIWQFTPGASPVLLEVASALSGGVGEDVFSARWSPDGKYIAVARDNTSGSGNDLTIMEFDVDTTTLTELVSINPGGGGSDIIVDAVWSPDGKLLSVAGGTGDTGVYLYKFDPSSTIILTELTRRNSSEDFSSVSWSPDGQYVAAGALATALGENMIYIYTALSFAQKNVIKDNTVYCNSNLNSVCPVGVGISGSNTANMIMGNVAYNNPMSYEFVTNVFDGLSNSIPSVLQNIAILGCQPPLITVDLADTINILAGKICDMQTKVDAILLAV